MYDLASPVLTVATSLSIPSVSIYRHLIEAYTPKTKSARKKVCVFPCFSECFLCRRPAKEAPTTVSNIANIAAPATGGYVLVLNTIYSFFYLAPRSLHSNMYFLRDSNRTRRYWYLWTRFRPSSPATTNTTACRACRWWMSPEAWTG